MLKDIQKTPAPQTQTYEEDVVSSDIKKFRALVKGTISKVFPFFPSLAGLIFRNFRTIILLIGVLSFLGLLVYVGVNLPKAPIRETGQTFPAQGNIQVPTAVPYTPYKPSLYAEDPEILRLEEDVQVLEKELARIRLREGRLILPKLDFNISF